MYNPFRHKFPAIDFSWDWEEKGYSTSRIGEIVESFFKGELENVALYKENGSKKWIFTADFHNQPRALAVGRYSSSDYFRHEHSVLKALAQKAPQFFPFVQDFHLVSPRPQENPKANLSVSIMECLDYMNTVFDTKKLGIDLEELAHQEGYAAGYVLGKTGQVATDPHPTNTLTYQLSSGGILVKFIDGERFTYHGNLPNSITKLCSEYQRGSCIRSEIIHNWKAFTRGLDQGLEDSQAHLSH